jgi:crotonobetainyl-CoA:carnitine CoA-transferase CaiB-like acyl-CoA transferase
MTGPRAAEAGYDYIMQAMAGWMSLTGDPDGPPTKSGLSLVDLSGGYVSAIALLSGLWRARRDGVGCDCDISLYETALHELMYLGTWTASAGYVPRRMPESAHPSIVPFQAFETADGWITVACAKQKFWERLCGALGRQELLEDPRYSDFAARNSNREELLSVLREDFLGRGTEEWLRVLSQAGVPHGPVYEVAEALEDRQAQARGDVVEVEHPQLGAVRQVASPLRVSGEPNPLERAPFRGEHTEEVLREVCGYSSELIAELRAQGTFGAEQAEAPGLEAPA